MCYDNDDMTLNIHAAIRRRCSKLRDSGNDFVSLYALYYGCFTQLILKRSQKSANEIKHRSQKKEYLGEDLHSLGIWASRETAVLD